MGNFSLGLGQVDFDLHTLLPGQSSHNPTPEQTRFNSVWELLLPNWARADNVQGLIVFGSLFYRIGLGQIMYRVYQFWGVYFTESGSYVILPKFIFGG